MEMITAKIDNINIEVPKGTTILEAAKTVQIKIPTLCKHEDVVSTAACGICVVKVKGSKKMLRACCTNIEHGMEITTQDSEIVEIRRTVIELILSDHPNDCLKCGRNNDCELQTLAADFGIREQRFYDINKDLGKDSSTKTIVLEPAKCIKCGRCVEVCQNKQTVWALNFLQRGINVRIAAAGDIELADSPCVRCGQCSAHCPTGAIFEYDETQKTWEALLDKEKYCVVQIAPAVRVAIGEAFGFKTGELVTKKLYAALRRMGFNRIFDTNFGADVTIMEEASEFIERFVNKKHPLPLITSCCPAWVDFMEKFYPDAIAHFSSCKSPHEMVGVLSKTYYAEKNNIDPSKMFVVSIMPCTAKKYEIQRAEDMFSSGFQDVDVSLTTRELIRMIKQAGINFKDLKDEEADSMLGDYSGAGTIFGATGGVMEAALRTAYFKITGEELGDLNISAVRGIESIKEGEIDIKGTKVKIAVAHGLENVAHVINKFQNAIKNNEELPYHFIEVMACPGGCVGGGGQPYGINNKIRIKRGEGLYTDDKQSAKRCSHQNPSVIKLYEDYLGSPLSEKARHLLHNKYTARKVYKK
ncbi:MAG: NADH-dependent [FeFe] hydrogenase, group A6 [Elusimicrobiota bacterium]